MELLGFEEFKDLGRSNLDSGFGVHCVKSWRAWPLKQFAQLAHAESISDISKHVYC